MTNIHGNKVVVDSDALIGLIHEDDTLHKRCLRVVEYLAANSFATLVPGPIILEAATTLAKDKTIRRPDLAQRLIEDYAALGVTATTKKEFAELARLYQADTVVKNTPFDYLVLATARIQDVKVIFSFDGFYKKHGLVLAEELLDNNRL